MDIFTLKRKRVNSIDNWDKDIENIDTIVNYPKIDFSNDERYNPDLRYKKYKFDSNEYPKEDTWDLDVYNFGIPSYNIEESSVISSSKKTNIIYQHKWGKKFRFTKCMLSTKKKNFEEVSELEHLPHSCYCLWDDDYYYPGKLVKRKRKRGKKLIKPYQFIFDDDNLKKLMFNLNEVITII